MTNPSRDPIFLSQEVASATECTGLMPAQIETEDEGRNLSEMEAIHSIPHGIVDGKGKKE